MKPAEMRTAHLFYSVRMIFNHTAPPAFRIPGCKRYDGPDRWPAGLRRDSMAALLSELITRSDIAPWMFTQLLHMQQAMRSILKDKLNERN